MAATNANRSGNDGQPQDFYLTPQQQNLLFAALQTNNQPISKQALDRPQSVSPTSLQTSPAIDGLNGGVEDTPYLQNLDYDFGDSSFDMSFADDNQLKMIGDLPGGSASSESPENDSPDKRAHPEDEDDDDDENPHDPKRHEGSEKVAKKPGRKPLTSEPSSKRKAQNRAAQRAFRERKEKHLKDLETKVDELQKASDDANNENKVLRAQVEQMTAELKEYRNRLTLTNGRSTSQGSKPPGAGTPAAGNLNDVNFQFEFPKFGVLPGPNMNNNNKASQAKPASASPLASLGARSKTTSSSVKGQSKENSVSPVSSNGKYNGKDDFSNISAFFDPAMTHASMSTSRTSTDSASPFAQNNGTTSTSSPSASSQSNCGPTSSCGTSPEPFNQSPMGFKPVDAMTTIGEEQSSMTTSVNSGSQNNGLFAGIDPTSFDWLAQQSAGGQFDPQLFQNYRDPQDSVFGGNSANPFDDSFFNDALDADFFMPYNVAPSPNLPKKTNLIEQIDADKNRDDDIDVSIKKQSNGTNQSYGCPEVWDKLQKSEKVKNGEFDLDGLCSELQKKAKCSGTGPVVSEADFMTVYNKWSGKEGTGNNNA